MNRTVLVLVVCVLAVLAGCGAGPSDDGSTGTDAAGGSDGVDSTETSGATGTTASTTGSDTGTSSSESTASTTAGQGGETLDPETYTRFVSALESAGSFTATERTSLTTADGNASFSEATFETVARVDVGADRGLAEGTTEVTAAFGSVSGETERYTDGETTYQRETIETGGVSQTQYDVSVTAAGTIEPVTFESVAGSSEESLDATEREFEQIQFTRVGTETYDGVEVTRYEASGSEVTDIVNAGLEESDDASFSQAAVALLVDGEGIIRYQSFTFTFDQDGATYDAELVRTIEAVGSTTVEEPDWLDEAVSQSGR